jgi:hypothetical protein
MAEEGIRRGILFFLAVMLIVAAFLSGVSFIPYEIVRHKLDLITVDGTADVFTEALFNNIAVWFRFLSALLFLGAIALFSIRRRLAEFIIDLANDSAFFIKSATAYFTVGVRREEKAHLGLLMAAISAGAVIRLLYINQPMRIDECFTFTNCASHPFYMCMSQYLSTNNHLFHTFFVRISYLIFGNDPWALRLPALLAGVLMIPVSYILARRFYGKYAAIIGAFLVSFSAPLIAYSANSRGYTMLGLITLLAFCLATYLRKSSNLFAWLLFSVISALGLYTIPIMIYPLGLVVSWLFLSILSDNAEPSYRRRLTASLLFSVIAAAAITIILYIPVFIVSFADIVSSSHYALEGMRGWSFLSTLQNIVSHINAAASEWNGGMTSEVKVLIFAAFLISIFAHRKISRYHLHPFLGVVLWIIPALLIQGYVGVFPRIWLFLLPLYLLCASCGIAYILRVAGLYTSRYKNLVLGTFLAGLSAILAFNIIYTKAVYPVYYGSLLDDADAVTKYLKTILRRGDVVISPHHNTVVLEYYFDKNKVDPECWKTASVGSSDHVFLVLPDYDYNEIRRYLTSSDLISSHYEKPDIVKVFPSSTVYGIKRRR